MLPVSSESSIMFSSLRSLRSGFAESRAAFRNPPVCFGGVAARLLKEHPAVAVPDGADELRKPAAGQRLVQLASARQVVERLPTPRELGDDVDPGLGDHDFEQLGDVRVPQAAEHGVRDATKVSSRAAAWEEGKSALSTPSHLTPRPRQAAFPRNPVGEFLTPRRRKSPRGRQVRVAFRVGRPGRHGEEEEEEAEEAEEEEQASSPVLPIPPFTPSPRGTGSDGLSSLLPDRRASDDGKRGASVLPAARSAGEWPA
ncbi:MAG: hypothetical protein BJ554DRAFT_1032 [Olpidium bornovanus]|uniref:Uncharacterized protein n=1 Tax=Olpidium bornovanus TaxID=278681 RepID=A0A8H7ZSR2_9FUNG|nr:MAG: hypothetical protein BJ554DRAFT_1032 [Olpidium bornovanus]